MVQMVECLPSKQEALNSNPKTQCCQEINLLFDYYFGQKPLRALYFLLYVYLLTYATSGLSSFFLALLKLADMGVHLLPLSFSAPSSFSSCSPHPHLSPFHFFFSFSPFLSSFPFPFSFMGEIIDQLTDLGQAGRGCSVPSLPRRRGNSLFPACKEPRPQGGAGGRESQWTMVNSSPARMSGILLITRSSPFGLPDTLIFHTQFICASFLLFSPQLLYSACSHFSPSFYLPFLFSSFQNHDR